MFEQKPLLRPGGEKRLMDMLSWAVQLDVPNYHSGFFDVSSFQQDYIIPDKMIGDLHTKPLQGEKFRKFRYDILGSPLPMTRHESNMREKYGGPLILPCPLFAAAQIKW